MQCSNRSVLTNEKTGQVISVPCLQWKCEACAKLKGNWVTKRLLAAMLQKQGRPRLMTLTLAEDVGKLYATQQLNRFITRMHQKGYMTAYFWCKEFQKRGARHFHIIVHEYIPIQEIAAAWHVGYAFIGYLKGSNPSKYVAKYLTKGNDKRYEYRERRYGCSRGYLPTVVHVPNPDWTFYTRYQWMQQWGDELGERLIKQGHLDIPDMSWLDDAMSVTRLPVYT